MKEIKNQSKLTQIKLYKGIIIIDRIKTYNKNFKII